MSKRFGVLVVAAAVAAGLSVPTDRVAAQSQNNGTARSASLKTPWGEPDLQGIWNGETLTPLERPARWSDKPVLSPEEAAAVEKWVASAPGRDDRSQRGTERDVAGAYNELWSPPRDVGLSDRRTGLIIDPPDGRIPPLTPDAAKKAGEVREYLRALLEGTASRPGSKVSPRRNEPPPMYNIDRMNRSDGPEDRSTMERCFGTPMPIVERAVYRIVQSPGQVGIYVDFGQGQGFLRTMPVNGSPPLPSTIRLLHGDSRGRWEGDTLVVSVSNFSQKMDFGGARENLQLTERFTRVAADRLNYRVTVEDATTWTRPWTFELALNREPDRPNRIYESTCHEGNYGLLGMLANTRAAEALFAKGQGPDPAMQDNATGGGTGEDRSVANFPR